MITNKEPLYIEITLSEGADFVLNLALSQSRGSWPQGTSARIVLDTLPTETTWNAIVIGPLLRWKVESEFVTRELIPEGTAFRAFLSMPEVDGTADYKPFYGNIRRNDK